MTAWARIEDESHGIVEPVDPAPRRSARRWVKLVLITLAVAVAAVVFVVYLPSALASDPSGGCGGG